MHGAYEINADIQYIYSHICLQICVCIYTVYIDFTEEKAYKAETTSYWIGLLDPRWQERRC